MKLLAQSFLSTLFPILYVIPSDQDAFWFGAYNHKIGSKTDVP